jgi:hypothetical protein
MTRAFARQRWLPAFCVALLLLGQAGAALHAFEHDIGAPQGKPCSSCVTAAQLGTASTDGNAPDALPPASSPLDASPVSVLGPGDTVCVRSRGPPLSS